MKNSFLIFFFLITHYCTSQISDKDTMICGGNQYVKTFVYKNKSRYYILDMKKNVIFKKLKYCCLLGLEYQVIDKNNNMYYITIDSLKIVPKDKVRSVVNGGCGNTAYHKLYFECVKNLYYAYELIDNSMLGNEDTIAERKLLVSIPRNEVDSMFFSNRLSTIAFSGNFGLNNNVRFGNKNLLYNPRQIIFKKNKLFGIYNKTSAIYDDVYCRINEYLECGLTIIKVNNLLNYLELNKPPKYLELGDYEYTLAKIKLPNGKSGYIDIEGNEYF